MIDFNKIDLKGKSTGQIKVVCPNCSHTRKKKSDPCLSVNIDKGLAKCYNCDEVSIRDIKEVKTYNYPIQEWQNFTNLSDTLVKWVKDTRNISQQTLIDCKITEEKYFQPALNKEVNNIVFNYFEGNKLLNKKYRSGSKNFTQCKNAKKIFYGINDIIGYSECYIVEGEFDKLAFWEAGYKNCISVPNGAGDLNDIFETCENYLKDLDKIYIAVDTDEKGLLLEKELIKRFGKWKCSRILFKGKDANDDLKLGVLELQESISNPISYPVDGTFNAKDIEDNIFTLYDNGISETIKPKNERFKEINKNFSLLDGQLTVVTGIPSHGKSNFIEDYALNLVADLGKKLSFFSPEHFPLEQHQSVIIEKVMGKPFYNDFVNGDYTNPRITKEEIKEYTEWSKDKIFLTYPDKGETVDWEWLLSKFKEQMYRFGIDIFIIDAWNKVSRNNPDSLGETNQCISNLVSFAQGYGVNIFLIAHPVKMQKNEDGTYKVPDLYSVSGSADFRNQTHNGLSVHRYFPDKNNGTEGYVEVYNLKTKFKHQGEIGAVSQFKFDASCNRYYPRYGFMDRNCLFKKEETTDNKPLPTNDNFDNEVEEMYEDKDCPF